VLVAQIENVSIILRCMPLHQQQMSVYVLTVTIHDTELWQKEFLLHYVSARIRLTAQKLCHKEQYSSNKLSMSFKQ